MILLWVRWSIEYAWDKSKPRINKTKHGVDFSSIDDFDWTTAFVMEDQRRDYGEILNIALGFIRSRLHALVFTKRNEKIRIIGLRKANETERSFYAQATGVGHR